jgi:Spy/CpxP family protein refolding chaperone
MTKNRFEKSVAVAAGVAFLFAAPALTRAQTAQPVAAHAPAAAMPGAQQKNDANVQDDFSALNLTDDQKTAIDKIRKDGASHKETVERDPKLTPEQKDAFLTGYARMQYGMIFRVLSPEQQRQVRQKIIARRAADQAAQKKKQPLPH